MKMISKELYSYGTNRGETNDVLKKPYQIELPIGAVHRAGAVRNPQKGRDIFITFHKNTFNV